MPVCDRHLIRLGELLGRELADRLQHPEAVAGTTYQALVEQRLQRIRVGLGNLLRGLQRGATRQHRETGEQRSLRWGEQVVAPLDGGSQGSVAGIGVASSPQKIEALG